MKRSPDALLVSRRRNLAADAVFVLIFAALTVFSFVRKYNYAFRLLDLRGQRVFCALTLRGIDPYTQIGAANPADPLIGAVPEGYGAAPWGCLLGNLFYPGFLSERAAVVWYFVLNALAVAGIVYLLVSELRHRSALLVAFTAAAAVTTYYLVYCLSWGNAGAVICIFAMAAVMLCEKHPYFAGVLLAFGMTKPQVTLLICLALLLKKQMKTLITAAVITLASWGAVSVLVRTSPLRLLSEFMETDTGMGNQRCGLFHFLYSYFHMDATVVTLISMAFCSLLTVLAFAIAGKRRLRADLPSWSVYAVPCLLTTFWSYNWRISNDHYILLLPMALLILLVFEETRIRQKIGLFLLFVFVSLKYVVLFWFRRIIGGYLYFLDLFRFDNENLYYDFLLLFGAFLLLALITQRRGEAKTEPEPAAQA